MSFFGGTELLLLVGDIIFTLIEIASTGHNECGIPQETGHSRLLMAKKYCQMGRPEYHSGQWTMILNQDKISGNEGGMSEYDSDAIDKMKLKRESSGSRFICSVE